MADPHTHRTANQPTFTSMTERIDTKEHTS